MNLLRRLWLFIRIVWRYDETETRMSAGTAWAISGIIWRQP